MAAAELTFKPDDGKALACREGEERSEYHESASGLRLRVTRQGARTWFITYWSPTVKTARRLKLGDAFAMPLAEARREARKALHAVEQEARDPHAERLAARQREREERKRRAEERERVASDRARRRIGFGKLCEQYIHERSTKPSGRFSRRARPNTVNNWRAMLQNHVAPVIGSRPPEEMTRGDFRRTLEGAVERAGPSMGPRTRDFLIGVWHWIEQRSDELGVRLPVVSPLVGLPKIGMVKGQRERWLKPAEVWRFWRATEPEGIQGEALRFMLLTAARVSEAMDLTRGELNLTKRTWVLPAARHKAVDRDHERPLSSQALALLARCPQIADEDRVFGGFDLTRVVDRVRKRMGGENWEPRDLRRTAATLLAGIGVAESTISRILGHSQPDKEVPRITGVYVRWSHMERMRDALDRLGSWVDDTVSQDTEPGDVVSIERRA